MGKKLNKTAKSNAVTYGIVIAAWAVMMVLQSQGMVSNSISGLLVPVCIYSIMAVSLNLTVGILGDLSLGHAGFMCVGAFASALFTNLAKDAIPMTWLRFTLAILIGAAVAAVFGFLIAIPVLRLSGDYLAIVTLAFGEIIKNFLNILYVGKDSHGLHVSIKDSMSLGTRWSSYHQGTAGNYRNLKRCNVHDRYCSASDLTVYRAAPDPVQRRPCD